MPKRGYKQTPEHREKIRARQTGRKRPHARGWTHNGRRFVMHNGKEMLEHRVVMELDLGRPLEPSEVVHHRNGDPLDNRLENLELMSRSAHSTHHDIGKVRRGQPRAAWTDAQRAVYEVALRKRPRPSAETRQKISDTMKRVRAERPWSTRAHATIS